MAMTEAERWQLFTRLNLLLAGGELPSNPGPELCEGVCRLTGAAGLKLVVQEGEQRITTTWGAVPDEGAAPAGWTLEFPLIRVNADSHFTLYGQEPALDEDTRACAAALASALDSGLATQQMLQEERQQRRLAESLVEISQVENSTPDLEEVLSLILDRLADLVPYDSANVMLLEEGRLILHATRGYQDFTGPVDMSSISFVPARTALMNEVLEGKQPVILSDAKELPDWVWVPGSAHIRSWMGVPLRVKDQVIGLFSIDKATPDFFTPRHSELAGALATHAALALENARVIAQLRETQEQLAGLSTQVMNTQEQERQKIAMELHDHAGQALLGLRAELQILKHSLSESPEPVLDHIKYLDSIVLEISQDLRQLARDLRPPLLTELGLVPALEQYIEEFSRRMNIPVTFEYQHERNMERLPEKLELVCYRIIQEALTNLARHAQASQARIQVDHGAKELTLSVTDNGVGFTPHARREIEGFGLIGIRERVTAVGGQLQLYSQPGRGTQVVVKLPLQSESEP